MGLKLREIELLTKDKQALSSFLSELLEMEVRPHQEQVLLEREDLTLVVTEVEGLRRQNSHMFVRFETDSVKELEHLASRWEFLNYRYQLSSQKKPGVRNDGTWSSLQILDLDGRRWEFSCRSCLQLSPDRVKKLTSEHLN